MAYDDGHQHYEIEEAKRDLLGEIRSLERTIGANTREMQDKIKDLEYGLAALQKRVHALEQKLKQTNVEGGEVKYGRE